MSTTWYANIGSIYGIRYALTTYFDYRISNTDKFLKKLNKEREATIERLKEATKYNSTQQLLEKYGASPKQKEQPTSPSQKKQQAPQQPQQPSGPRTGLAPPPTANIQRPHGQPQPVTPQRAPPNASSPQGPSPPQLNSAPDRPGAEFAPNAFGSADQTRQFSATPATTFTQTHWYDRILDALLGEDETQPKNRLALICSECRLVNGQAPPGARNVEDIGRWRCSSCHAWNGKEKPREDVEGLVQGWAAERKEKERNISGSTDGGIDSDNRETEDDGGLAAGLDESSGVDVGDEDMEEVVDTPPSRSTRSKTKGKSKN
jgi:LSD1 subclass zinc finger protein